MYTFLQEIYGLLVDDSRGVTAILESALQAQPFQLICQRLLHHADDEYLFYFADGILSQSSSQRRLQDLMQQAALQPAAPQPAAAAKANLEQMLLLMLFGLVRWRDLDMMLVSAAAALHFQQVVKSLRAADALEVSLVQ